MREHMGWSIRTFHDGVHGAALLAETAVDALGHVDIVSGSTPAAIFTLLGLDGDGLSGADGLAQLAGNAALLTGRVAAKGVLATEARGDGALLEGVVDGVSGWIPRLSTPCSSEWPVKANAEARGKGAYGARKNCSSTTYMPRIISVSRKYFPALSREPSAPWSQRLGAGRRNPEGGGPAGRAARGTLVEKRAVAGALDARKSCVVGRARANMVIGLVLAMAGVVGAGRAERRVVVLNGTLTLPAWRFCKFNGLDLIRCWSTSATSIL